MTSEPLLKYLCGPFPVYFETIQSLISFSAAQHNILAVVDCLFLLETIIHRASSFKYLKKNDFILFSFLFLKY